MLTKKQKVWLEHLSNEKKIVIGPFDPTAEQKFQIVKGQILSILPTISVQHRGATSLGISGQDEIDVYIPVSASKFNLLIRPLTKLFGNPRSVYSLERIRFSTSVDGKHVDIFLINKTSDGWINGVKFEKYLKSHANALSKYRELKENGNGLSVKEYYTRKNIFINKILKMA